MMIILPNNSESTSVSNTIC